MKAYWAIIPPTHTWPPRREVYTIYAPSVNIARERIHLLTGVGLFVPNIVPMVEEYHNG